MSPSHRLAYSGSNIHIECLFEDEVVWIKRSGEIHPRHRIMGNSLILFSVEEDDCGIYACYYINQNGTLFEAQSIVKVGGNTL